MTGLGRRLLDLPGGGSSSVALGVSSDGTVILGRSNSANGNEAFKYENGMMTGLGDLPGGGFFSEARGVSSDGTVIVGQGFLCPRMAEKRLNMKTG